MLPYNVINFFVTFGKFVLDSALLPHNTHGLNTIKKHVKLNKTCNMTIYNITVHTHNIGQIKIHHHKCTGGPATYPVIPETYCQV